MTTTVPAAVAAVAAAVAARKAHMQHVIRRLRMALPARWRAAKQGQPLRKASDPFQHLLIEMDMFIAFPYFRSSFDVPRMRKWLPSAPTSAVLLWLSSVIHAVRRGCQPDARAFPRYQANLRLFCRQVVCMARGVKHFAPRFVTGLISALRALQRDSPHTLCDTAFVNAVVADLFEAAADCNDSATAAVVADVTHRRTEFPNGESVDDRIARIRTDIITFAGRALTMNPDAKERAIFEIIARAYETYQALV